jgi:thiol-disulfide isomerase/thioredoxin
MEISAGRIEGYGQFGIAATDTGFMLPAAPPVEGRDWLTTEPIPWQQLRGHVVVVLFWSLGCEASLLALRRLADMADRWPGEVVVVAVHTPRFPYEDDRDRAMAAVARHRIELPVVHDPDYLTWNRYNPDGWPATAVIGRSGKVMGMIGGADGFNEVGEVVATELARPDRRDRTSKPQTIELRRSVIDGPTEDSSLRFPGGIASTQSGTLVVADSGHDRLLIGSVDSDVRTFRPQMEITDIDNPVAVVCGSETVLYVVEGGSGSVLQLDLEYGTLDVLADDELAAPTALLIDGDGSLVVADAGHDLLLRIVAGSDGDIMIGTIAGCGVSGSRDGNSGQAELAQPVALARLSTGIAFCDAASSNLRLLTDDGRILTITGNDFFDWGLVDGPAHLARLQRPSGLCVLEDDSVVIVDSGNNRLRLLQDRRVSTLGLAGLEQPSAVASLPSGHLVVADTGNHRLVVADPAKKSGWPLAVYPASMTSVWEESTQDAP